jgi:hypothetical protein
MRFSCPYHLSNEMSLRIVTITEDNRIIVTFFPETQAQDSQRSMLNQTPEFAYIYIYHHSKQVYLKLNQWKVQFIETIPLFFIK